MNENLYKIYSNMVVCNNYVHEQQVILLRKLIKDHKLNKKANDIILKTDTDEAPDHNSIIMEYDKKEQNKIVKNLIMLACFDGDFDKEEHSYLLKIFPENTLYKYTNENNINKYIKKFTKKTKANFFARFFMYKIYSLINFIFCKFHKERPFTLPITSAKQKKMAKALSALSKSLTDCIKNDITNDIAEINDTLYGDIHELIKKYDDFVQKKIKSEPSIYLVGCSKAGKSTLFHSITGWGLEFIGKGKQGTTHYIMASNRNGIRILDTPGIDSASYNGKSDETLTLNYIFAADIILYVSSDGENLHDKEILSNIIKSNYVRLVINYKDGDLIRDKYKSLLDDPDKWKEENEFNRLSGYKENMERFLKAKGVESKLMCDYACVFAASDMVARKRSGKSELSKKQMKKIYESSNVGNIYKTIKRDLSDNIVSIRAFSIFSKAKELVFEIKTMIDNIYLTINEEIKNEKYNMDNFNLKSKNSENYLINLCMNENSELWRKFQDEFSEENIYNLSEKLFGFKERDETFKIVIYDILIKIENDLKAELIKEIKKICREFDLRENINLMNKNGAETTDEEKNAFYNDLPKYKSAVIKNSANKSVEVLAYVIKHAPVPFIDDVVNFLFNKKGFATTQSVFGNSVTKKDRREYFRQIRQEIYNTKAEELKKFIEETFDDFNNVCKNKFENKIYNLENKKEHIKQYNKKIKGWEENISDRKI